MTEKQLNIINTALELFANDGYSAVSTSRIAQEASVSEGLIFRHFNNKEGLLEAIVAQAEEKLAALMTPIFAETNPKEVLRKGISAPFQILKKDQAFWRLQFKLKWETKYNNPDKMKPWEDKLTQTFKQLNYEFPRMEAKKLLAITETTFIQILRNELKNKTAYKNFLLQSYKL